MKKVIFSCMLLALWVPAIAVNTLTEEFNGPTMTSFTVNASGTQGSGTVGTFDGSGHYVMTQDSYIYRWVSTGDFNMQTIFNAINMGTPPEPNASNYRVFNYLINHKGDNSENLVVFFHKNAVVTQFAVDTSIGGTTTRQYTEILPSLTSATLQVTWNEAAHTYVISAGFNGGAIAQKVSLNLFTASSTNRHEYFYGVSVPLPTSQPSVSFDQYVMTAGQTPIGQIDSFDDLTNWLGLGTQASLDTTTFHEGTGSMKCAYGTGLGWDVSPYKNKSYNFNYATAVNLTFWEKSALTGKERVNQLICMDTGNHVARYTCALPANTNWNKVSCPIAGFVIDGGATFDWANVRTIQIWFTSWDTMGSAVWIDDLQLENAAVSPVPPYQIASFDSWATDGWVDSRGDGLVVQENTIKQEGTGSMKIDWNPATTIYDVVPQKVFPVVQDWSSYANWAVSIWINLDLVGSSRLNQIIIYDNASHTGRYTVPVPTSAGWTKVVAKLSDFVWDNGVTPAQVNWNAITKVDLWTSCYPTPGNPIYLDDFQIGSPPPDPSLAWVMNAQKATITVDGSAADWAALTDSDELDFDLKAVPIQPNGDLHVKYKLAWDNDYLYVLVREVAGDTEAYEAADFAALNDGAGGDVLYDSLALFYDFTNTHSPEAVAGSISLWQILGLSSANRTDMMMTWTNGAWGPDHSGARTNGTVATSGTLGSRIIEAKLKWSDLATELTSDRQPLGGLVAAVQPGYVFGCDPRLADLEGYWTAATALKGAAWLNGKLWTPGVPSGKDIYSTDVKLVCKAADLTGNCSVNMEDFGQFAAQWSEADCTDLNGYCGGADIVMDGAVDITDLAKLVQQWLQ